MTISQISQFPEPFATEMVRFREFVDMCHGDQKYDFQRYIVHLDHTVEVALRYGCNDPGILMACLCHDIFEDTGTTEEQVRRQTTDPRTVEIAKLVTDEPGANRKEQKTKTYPKIRTSAEAVFVKLCDQIANIESSKAKSHFGILQMYTREHPEFEQALRVAGEYDDMWEHLAKLLQITNS